MTRSAALLLFALLGSAAAADPVTLAPVSVTEWKAVYCTVEAKDRIPARARIGGTLVALSVAEGDEVMAGQELARIVDDKLDFQLAALAAQREALAAQLANAEVDLQRGEDLLKNGVTTTQRVDALRTQVDVLKGQIASLGAQADVVSQQAKEGIVLAPVAGRVLDVPQTKGAVVMPGEPVAVVGGGGVFIRLAIPERHARLLRSGASVDVAGEAGSGIAATRGTLEKVYPQIENGRVIADVAVDSLPDTFIGQRVLVQVPVGERLALAVPQGAIITRAGLDFVAIATPGGAREIAIVLGALVETAGGLRREVLTGLQPGDRVITP